MEFFDILTKPEETMKKLLPKANLNEAIKNFAIYGIMIGLVIGVLFALVATFVAPLMAATKVPGATLIAGLGVAAIIVMPIVLALLAVIGSAISYGILWGLAKLLGGKGTFTQNYFLASKLLWPVLVVGIAAGILSLIPLLGFLIMLVIELYILYVCVILLSVANKISKLKALGVVIILLIIVFIIALIIGALVATALMLGNTY